MAKLNSKKRKNSLFTKKESLVGLTPDLRLFEVNFFHKCHLPLNDGSDCKVSLVIETKDNLSVDTTSNAHYNKCNKINSLSSNTNTHTRTHTNIPLVIKLPFLLKSVKKSLQKLSLSFT